MTDLQEVLLRWQNDLKFREEFKENPELTLERAGFKLSPEDLAKIKTKLDQSKDDKLDDRISK